MISRDIEAAARKRFDLVIIGGGIYGVALLREAARRGLSACLCEAGDFGGATSWNSLRIVHGGLRYLQTLDFRRFFQSVAARRHVARDFPSLVRPMRCIMPLYGEGMKRAAVMRMALLANDLLSARRNSELDRSVHLPGGEILDVDATHDAFPCVRAERLEGAACWSDYYMISSERILIEQLHDACRRGAVALNYAPVEGLVEESGRVCGVRVRERINGRECTVLGKCVVNCAGARVREVLRGRSEDDPALFRPSIAFNVLLDVNLRADGALAVAPPGAGKSMLFLVPQLGALLVGTRHLPRPAGTVEAVPTEQEVAEFLSLANDAVPGLGAQMSNVSRVFAGLLPAAVQGTAELAKREVVLDHGAAGGLAGLYTVSGVKFTTANAVAGRLVSMMGFARPGRETARAMVLSPSTSLLIDAQSAERLDAEDLRSALRHVAVEESAFTIDDILLRRTNWATCTPDLDRLRKIVADATGLPITVSGVASLQ